MQVYGRSSYYNSIYDALIVNNDSDLDPLGLKRVQIYIPSIHYEYENIYLEYIKDNNKKSNKYFNVFPWASCIGEVNNGDWVFGAYVNNKANEYIILGVNPSYANEVTNGTGGPNVNNGGGNTEYGSDDILDLTMPIILKNEVRSYNF